MRVPFVGGTTAVLIGWRGTTIDVDLVMRPEDDGLLRAIPALKEELQINVELASPADFIPIPPPSTRESRAGHQHLSDVREMVARGLIDKTRALEYFARIEPDLSRFPALDPTTFRRAVEATFQS